MACPRFARKLKQKKPAYRVHYHEVGIPWPDAGDGIRVSGRYAFVSDDAATLSVGGYSRQRVALR